MMASRREDNDGNRCRSSSHFRKFRLRVGRFGGFTPLRKVFTVSYSLPCPEPKQDKTLPSIEAISFRRQEVKLFQLLFGWRTTEEQIVRQKAMNIQKIETISRWTGAVVLALSFCAVERAAAFRKPDKAP